MNTVLSPELMLRRADDHQTVFPLVSEGVLQFVWQSRYGSILIEVIGADVFVDGQRVEPHVP